jgi:Flp pilus assembly protein TadD
VVLAIGLVALATTPALVALSQSHLTKSVAAYRRGDCRTTTQQADSSLSALDVRAEPYELLAFCDARAGRARPSIDAIRAAVDRDPNNWQYRYDLAIVRARAGRDPRSAARTARRLNPREARIRLVIRRFSRGGPREWRRVAREFDRAVR